MSGVLDRLIPASYNSIEFPCASVKTDGGHNLAEHKRADRDGSVQENTGRKPNSYALTVPFVNGLYKAEGEGWPNELYPNQYALFFAAIEDRSPGTLTHPEFGDRLVAPVSWSTEVNPDYRGGVIMQVQFVETLDINDDLNATEVAITGQGMESYAGSLITVYPPAEIIAADQGGLLSYVKTIQQAKGRAALATNSAVGSVERVIYQTSKLLDPGTDLPDNARTTVNRLVSALRASARSGAIKDNRTTGLYITPGPCLKSQVAQRTANTVAQITELNQQLTQPVIPEGTPVRYYT